MNKIKVLHILSSKTYNGAENVVCQINSMLQGTEDNIELIYCSLDDLFEAILKKIELDLFLYLK